MQIINTARATFNWLNENSYIVIGPQDLNDYYEMSLSEMCLAALITNRRSDERSITDNLLGDASQKVDAIERLILIKATL